MKTFKLLFILGCLFLSFNSYAQCFNMTVTNTFSPPGQDCFLITVSIENSMGPVIVSDGIHPDVSCSNDCSFVWCYDENEEGDYNVNIQCQSGEPNVPKLNCFQLEGCIVIVDN